MSEILTSIAQPMRYLIELDTPLVLKKNSGMLMEGDVEANTVVLEVFKTRDVPADLSGITFCLYFTRPDGNTLQPIAGTVKENIVQLTLTGGCYKYTGQYTMLVTMKKGEENRTVLKATGHMEGRNTENMIDPEGTFPTPEELLEILNVLDEALQSANTATENATAAATRANNAAAGIETVTATATELEPNEEATAQVIKGESGMHFAFGIPRGEKGEKGEKGDAGTAENVTIDSVAGLREALNNKQPKGDYLPADGTAADANKLGGKLPEEYLAADGTAADANKLGGKLPEAYATKESLEQYATKEDLENIDVGQLKEEVSQLKDDICASGAGAHNSIYRGKSIGSAVTAAQWEEIGAGTFGDMFVGDYWSINGITWRIAGFDYWYNFGDRACSKHHVLIVPDQCLINGDGSTTHWMNATDTTAGAYVGSDFYTGNNGNTGKAQCQSKAQSAFGSAHILTHREHLQNAVTNGYESSGAWYDSDIEIMNEKMVYGCDIFSNQSSGANIPSKYTIDNAQIPLFALDHSRICNRAHWWLRDVVGGSFFARVSNDGCAGFHIASNPSVGVRPAFAICA